MLRQSAAQYGDRVAFLYHEKPGGPEISRTYRQFLGDIEALGTTLLTLSLPRRRLAILADNSYEWAVVFFAAINGCGVVVPLDKLLPDGEVERLLQRGAIDVLFYGRKQQATARALAARQASLAYLVALQPEPPTDDDDDGRFLSLMDLIASGRQQIDAGDRRYCDSPVDPEALASLLYTSGTTEQAKGVMLSQSNICSNIAGIASILPIQPGERLLSVLPMHHTFENTAGLCYLLYCGGCICINDGLRYFLKNMQEWHIDVMIAVPLLFENVYRKLMEQISAQGKSGLVRLMRPLVRFLAGLGIDIRRFVFRELITTLGGRLRLVVVGAAAIDPAIIQAFTDFGLDFFMGYGLTEAAPVISCCNHRLQVIGSVGPPLPGIEVAIDIEDPTPGAIGEILTRSRSVMLGYYGNPQATAEAITADGWLRTGDMGYLDRTGSLHLTGRLKSLIVLSNGKKAFPEEIESLLDQIPGVTGSLVWGEANVRDGVDICALLQIDQAALPLAQPVQMTEIQRYLTDQITAINHAMPSYKSIDYCLITEEPLIRTTTLKIKRVPQLEQIHDWLQRHQLTMRQADGRLISE
jgi:long-chain acyl-CoA synthetase